MRILDPACGSGNFPYVTLEYLKRLEGEVLTALDQLGPAGRLELGDGTTVGPRPSRPGPRRIGQRRAALAVALT